MSIDEIMSNKIDFHFICECGHERQYHSCFMYVCLLSECKKICWKYEADNLRYLEVKQLQKELGCVNTR